MRVVNAGTAAERDGLRAMLGFDLLHFVGDEFERLIPPHALPLAFPLRANAHHRIVDTIRMVELLDRCRAGLRTEGAAIDRIVAVADDPADGALDALDNGAAAAMAHAAARLELFNDLNSQLFGGFIFSCEGHVDNPPG